MPSLYIQNTFCEVGIFVKKNIFSLSNYFQYIDILIQGLVEHNYQTLHLYVVSILSHKFI